MKIHIGIFWGAYKLMDCKEISLRQRIINLEHLGEVVHSPSCTVQRQLALILETSCCIDTDGDV